MEYLVEASAAEAEAISATLAAAKARQVNGEVELPDRDRGAEATPSGKSSLSLIKPDSAVPNSVIPAGVRLHHRAVSQTNCQIKSYISQHISSSFNSGLLL